MAFSPGTRLGRFDARFLMVNGGMGRLCRAADTWFNRHVSPNIVPDALAADPDRLARFQLQFSGSRGRSHA